MRGENVQAFPQAFLASGAAATVTTLWRVADRPTAEFMKQFYFALANGESKAGATARTQSGAYAYLAPAAVAMIVLVFVPFAVGAGMSLFWHDAGHWTFIGLRNFADILASRDAPITDPLSFYFTLAVTALWTVVNVALHVIIGVTLALLLRDPLLKLRGVYRVLLIVPWAVPNYITALIWKGMFHRQFGAINGLLALVGLQPISLVLALLDGVRRQRRHQRVARLSVHDGRDARRALAHPEGARRSRRARRRHALAAPALRHAAAARARRCCRRCCSARCGPSTCSTSSSSSPAASPTAPPTSSCRRRTAGPSRAATLRLRRGLRGAHLRHPRRADVLAQPRDDEERRHEDAAHRSRVHAALVVASRRDALPGPVGHQDGALAVAGLLAVAVADADGGHARATSSTSSRRTTTPAAGSSAASSPTRSSSPRR